MRSFNHDLKFSKKVKFWKMAYNFTIFQRRGKIAWSFTGKWPTGTLPQITLVVTGLGCVCVWVSSNVISEIRRRVRAYCGIGVLDGMENLM